jgi:hypothetical protein
MTCVLCKKSIDTYNAKYHQLKIDDSLSVDLCPDCISKFLDWQKDIFSTLFPTPAAKKWAKKDRDR